MKKVLCLIDGLGKGGAERQMIGLVSNLKKRGIDVDLVIYSDKLFYSEQIKQYNIRINKIEGLSTKFKKLLIIRSYIIKNKYDTVIAYKTGPTIIGCLLKMFKMKFKLIVSERNTSQRLSLKEKVKFWMFRYSDYIVSNSISQAEFIKRHYPKLYSKTSVITNFTDISTFIPKLKSENNPLTIVTTARIARQKNVLGYLEIVKKVKEKGIPVNFVWYGDAGDNNEEYSILCHERIDHLGINNIFKFKPSSREIQKEYIKYDIFCLPSLYEGYPNVVCEAMSCGLPILCSRVCDNPYLVKEGVNGFLFDPHNINEAIDKIIKMVNMSPEERIEMGSRNRMVAESKFSEEEFVEKYLKLINS